MASLKPSDPTFLQRFFESVRGPGYVLDFTDASFQQFVKEVTGKDIYAAKYEKYGTSKGKRLKAFWEIESDQAFGALLFEMAHHYEANKSLTGIKLSEQEIQLLSVCYEISDRLLGKKQAKKAKKTEEQFLQQDFGKVSINKLNLEDGLIEVLEQRLIEIQKCLKSESPLSVIFLCGSTLEGILLGTASKNPKKFNTSTGCPKNKTDGKPLPFNDWTLNDFINVAYETGFLGLDVKMHSHSLRDFRNYIHPYAQWSSKFNPDQHTALISWQVLQAAISDLNKSSK